MPNQKQASNKSSNPLPGMEREPEVIKSSPAARKQEYKQSQGKELASALAGSTFEIVQDGTGYAIVDTQTGEFLNTRAAAFGVLLQLAAEDDNHAAALLNREGEAFFGGMALWKSSLRLDPNAMETMRRRSRAVGRHALHHMMKNLPAHEVMARKFGWAQRLTLKLITLTMPHITGANSEDETRRIQRAFTLLRKRDYWCRITWGGIKGIEDALDFDGPHVHIHALYLTRFIDHAKLCEEWRECIDTATREAYGYGLAEDVSPFIDIRQVRRRGTKARSGTCELDEGLKEATKYVTKPKAYLKDDQGRRIPQEVLVDICEVRRWPRMFEVLGGARNARKADRRDHAARLKLAGAASAALDSIHRAYLTAGIFEVPANLRDVLADRGCFDVDDVASCYSRTVHVLKELAVGKPSRSRPPSWRDLLDILPLSDWLGIVLKRVRRAKKFRLNWLMDHNPMAMICTFDGLVYDCAE